MRRHGGGRKPLIVKDATLIDDLRSLVEPSTPRGSASIAIMDGEESAQPRRRLRELGHQISHSAVGDLLRSLGYSLQANRKTCGGGNHPDRDAQFGYMNDQVKAALAAGQPAISATWLVAVGRVGLRQWLWGRLRLRCATKSFWSVFNSV